MLEEHIKEIADCWDRKAREGLSSMLYGGTSCSSTYAGQSTKHMTMDDILEAKRVLEEMGPAPSMPTLHCMPWPMKQRRVHKKKRINKKWRRKYGMYEDRSVDKGQVYFFDSKFHFYSKWGQVRQVVLAYPESFRKLTAMLPGAGIV